MSNDVGSLDHGARLFLTRVAETSGVTAEEMDCFFRIPQRHMVVQDGQILSDVTDPDDIVLVGSGLISQRSQLNTSDWQTTGIFVPGEVANLPRTFANVSDASFFAHSETEITTFNKHDFLDAVYRQPALQKAFLTLVAIEARRAQEWLVNIGTRRASARLAYFFLECAGRLDCVGLRHQASYALPLTQVLLAEILGLSLVHTNKSYKSLEKGGFVSMDRRRLKILDEEGLRRCAGCQGRQKEDNPLSEPTSPPLNRNRRPSVIAR